MEKTMNVQKSVAVVIVTFNRSAKLSKVIDAVCAQTVKPDAIYIIDNASTDDTPKVIAKKPDTTIHHIRLPENIGGAGGFHEGIKLAYAEGHDYLWISDDDAYPEPDAVEKLLFQIQDFEERTAWKPGFACSMVKWTDGSLCEMNVPKPIWDWPRFYSAETPCLLVESCSFVSVLVPRWAIEKHGLPIKEYFIWHDDTEYTQRLSQSYPGLFCPDSVVVHDTPENQGVHFGLVNTSNLWKFKYGARNESSKRHRTQGLYGVLAFVHNVRGQMAAGKVPRGLRRQIYAAIWRGLFFRPIVQKP
jgi:GT2 family glycosyltransferase